MPARLVRIGPYTYSDIVANSNWTPRTYITTSTAPYTMTVGSISGNAITDCSATVSSVISSELFDRLTTSSSTSWTTTYADYGEYLTLDGNGVMHFDFSSFIKPAEKETNFEVSEELDDFLNGLGG